MQRIQTTRQFSIKGSEESIDSLEPKVLDQTIKATMQLSRTFQNLTMLVGFSYA